MIHAHCLPGKAKPVTLITAQAGRGNVRGGGEMFFQSNILTVSSLLQLTISSNWNVIFMFYVYVFEDVTSLMVKRKVGLCENSCLSRIGIVILPVGV